MKKEAENPENPQLKKEEVRTFEKSIMSGVPKELRFFSLNEGNRTPIGWDMNDRRHDEEEQSSESHSSVMPKLEYPQQEDAMEAEIDPLEGNGNNREDNNEIQAIMKRNKLKNLTKVVYELIKDEGVVHQSQLKQLFLSKFEGANNPLIKATKDNLNRRFYDIRNTLIKNYFIKSRNKNLSITDVVQHKKLDLLRLRRQVSKREKKIQEKRMELNFKQKGKDALKRVTYRNKKMKSSSEKIQSPFFIYLHDQQQYQKLPVRKQDKYTVITINKNMEEIGEFELLEPLSQALKEAADKKSKSKFMVSD